MDILITFALPFLAAFGAIAALAGAESRDGFALDEWLDPILPLDTRND